MISTICSFMCSSWTLFFIAVIFAIYKWSTATFDYFAKRNIPYDKPWPLFGNFPRLILQLESGFEATKNFYLKYRHLNYVGYFEMRQPMLLICNPEIIKQVGVKDFQHFMNHRSIVDAEDDPIFGNSLFMLKDQKWRNMRSTLSPAFTGSKMQLMFKLVEVCSRTSNEWLKNQTKGGQTIELEVKDFFSHFTNDVIASCAFGLQMNSHSEKDHEFYQKSKKAVNFGAWVILKVFLFASFNKVMKFFKVRLFNSEFADYFRKIVTDAMEQREAHNIYRPDMIQILMEARKGTLHAHDVGKADAADGFAVVQEVQTAHVKDPINWSDDELMAQCFLFFLAGYETSSTVMSHCAQELMENSQVQNKLIEEIDRVRKELAGEPLSHESLQKMKYMDMVISETLRKWPPGIGSDRVCTKAYIIGDEQGEHVKLSPGDVIVIPSVGLHYNPDFFPNPSKFDPERFSEENKGNIKPFTYLPFGIGPRSCIGSRFALMEIKAILFHLLSEFSLEASQKSTIPIKIANSGFSLRSKNGYWMNFKPRN